MYSPQPGDGTGCGWESPTPELQEMLHLPHPCLVRDECLGHSVQEAKLGGDFIHTEIKQLGFPEDAVLNHCLHSHPKGGVTAAEVPTRHLPFAMHSWNRNTFILGLKKL